MTGGYGAVTTNVIHPEAMDDTFALHDMLERPNRKRVTIICAGYIGLEMAEALTARGDRSP